VTDRYRHQELWQNELRYAPTVGSPKLGSRASSCLRQNGNSPLSCESMCRRNQSLMAYPNAKRSKARMNRFQFTGIKVRLIRHRRLLV
jgi:hypothetical protein